LESVEEIAAVEGVDVLFVGPADLSFALGVPRDFKNPKFIAALQKVLDACNKNKVAAGILAFTAEAAVEYRKMGFKFIAINSDSTLLAGAITNALEIAKNN
jgi:2-dehydro-3-deoxyglucarate aldolase/4-hydroxy-2-oxoheptanedioate aldolase